MTSDSRQRALASFRNTAGITRRSKRSSRSLSIGLIPRARRGGLLSAWGTWVVAGAPICPLDRMVECGLAFAEAAKDAGYRVCFFGTAARFAEQISQHATHVKIGEQPCWDPTRWHGDAKRMKLIGSQIRRAERKGLTVRQVSPQVMNDSHSYERQQAER